MREGKVVSVQTPDDEVVVQLENVIAPYSRSLTANPNKQEAGR